MAGAPTVTTDAAQAAATPVTGVADAQHAPFGGSPIEFHPNVGKLEEDVPAVIQETRRGWKTSEFWASIATVFLDLGLEVDSKDKIIVSALTAVYALARSIAKNGVPNVTPAA